MPGERERERERERVKCELCSYEAHVIAKHLFKEHGLSPIEYMERYSKPWASAYGKEQIMEIRAQQPRKKVKITINEFFGDTVALDDETLKIFAEAHELTPPLDPTFVPDRDLALRVYTVLFKKQRNNIFISGPSGAGKTSLVRWLAAKTRSALYKLTGYATMTPAHLFGAPRVRGNEIVYVYGPVSRWLKTGGILLFDEIDTLDPATFNALKPVLEEPRNICLADNDSEVIHGHPDCRFVATANTFGRGDDTGAFVNTEVQSIADLRRFNGFFSVNFLEEKVETALLESMFQKAPVTFIQHAVHIANEVRSSHKAGFCTRNFSTAELINWVENYLEFWSAHEAANISFLNSYEEEAAAQVRSLIASKFGQPEKEQLLVDDKAVEAAAEDEDSDE